MLQSTAARRLEEEIDRLSTQASISAEECYIVYALSSVLDYPLLASTEASMLQLLRLCSRLRGKTTTETASACLDILETIAGAYFGQDMHLRMQYREYGVHI